MSLPERRIELGTNPDLIPPVKQGNALAAFKYCAKFAVGSAVWLWIGFLLPLSQDFLLGTATIFTVSCTGACIFAFIHFRANRSQGSFWI
jgi:hypothetical protein